MTVAIDVDAIVIGGGIAGTSVAYFMSPHSRVVVLEREAYPGMHATGRSAALFSETYGPTHVRALTRASRAFLDQPPAGFADHALLSPRGALIIGAPEQRAQVQALHEVFRTDTNVRLLSEPELRDIVPVLEPQFANIGLHEPGAMDIDVNSVHQGFIRGLKARDSTLECGAEIRAIEHSQGRWIVDIGARAWRAPLLINAAGAWADSVATIAGVAPIGIEPRRRSAFLFAPPEGTVVTHWPFVTSADDGFYFKPDAGMLLGSPANADPVHAHDVQPEELDIAMAIYRIEEATTMRIHRPTRTWAGLRSFASDGELVGGFAPGAKGFFWMAGLGGYGIQTCAAMGEACAALALGRPLPAHIADAGITPAILGVERLRN